jgi:hypothetical protein
MELTFQNPSKAREVRKSRLKIPKAKARANLYILNNLDLIGVTTVKSLLTQRTIAATHLRTTLPLPKGERASLLPKRESSMAEAKDGPTANFPVTIPALMPTQLLILTQTHRHPTFHGSLKLNGLKTTEISDSCFNTTVPIHVVALLQPPRTTNPLFLDMNMNMSLIHW